MASFSFFGGLTFLIFIINTVAASQQTISFYNGTNCQASAVLDTFTDERELFPPTWKAVFGSIKLNGLWKVVTFDKNTNETFDIILSSSTNNSETCHKTDEITGNRRREDVSFFWVDRVGPTHLNSKELYLYALDSFERVDVIVVDKDRPNLDMQIGSYAFFGNTTWLLYPRANYQREPICLKQNNPNKDGENTFSFNMDRRLKIESVRLDPIGTCNNANAPTTKNPNGAAILIVTRNLLLISILLPFFAVKY